LKKKMLKHPFVLALVLFMLCALSACAGGFGFVKQKPEGKQDKATLAIVNQGPFNLEIFEELNDGQNLYLRAGLRSEIPWEVKQLGVRVTTLKDGESKEIIEKPLSELLSPVVKPRRDVVPASEQIEFAVTVASSEVSDYQLELLWGKEARSVVGIQKVQEISEEPVQQKVSLKDLVFTALSVKCDKPPCGITYSAVGKLVNLGSEVVEEVRLEVGFQDINISQSGREAVNTDANEKLALIAREAITLNQINLQPGAARAIRIGIEESVPARDKDRYKPVVRVVSDL
jgi:hypothetical protein